MKTLKQMPQSVGGAVNYPQNQSNKSHSNKMSISNSAVGLIKGNGSNVNMNNY